MRNKKLKIKSKIFSYIFIFEILFFIFNLNFAQSADAQNIDLGIYPPIAQIDATPPTDIKYPIYIENSSDKSITLNIIYKAFIPAGTKDGQLQLVDTFDFFADPLFFNKVRIFDKDRPVKLFVLSPKQQKNLEMEIKLPVSQAKGDYYFSVIFKSAPDQNLIANSSYQTGGIAMNTLLTVGPKGKTTGYIQKFSSPFLVNSGPLAFSVEINNTSGHFITTKGEIIVKNLFGQNVGKISLLPVNILSNSSRRIPDSIQVGTDSREYNNIKKIIEKNEFPVAVWREKFLFGPYTANLTIALSDQGPVFKKTIYFFAFPLTYLLALVLIILIIIFIVLRVRKRIS